MSTNIATKKPKGSKLISNLINTLYYGVQDKEEQLKEEFFINLYKAQQEMYDAQNFFDNVVDPELIDHAIYKMEAARSKYTYMLKQAKDQGIRIEF